MRLLKSFVLIPALALLAMSCAPHRSCRAHHGEPCMGGKPGMAMMHGCGPESCTYKSRCFSSGAVSANDGVCQACSGGKWVAASGCQESDKPCGGGCDHHHMQGKKPVPCHHGDHGHPHDH